MPKADLAGPRPTVTGNTTSPVAWRAILLIAAVVAVAHTIASFTRGYWFDEVYMVAIGRNHLDWGSADQPPLAPLLAGIMDWIAPGSLIALRTPAILATSAAVVVAALIARELGGDRRAQVITAGAQATALWISLTGHWLTPYTVEPVQWLVLAWLLVRWLRVRDDRLLLVLGLVVGVAAETKFQVMLLCAVLLASVLVLGPRELLRTPMLWGGAVLGVLVALPTLIWQAANGWPQLRMSSIVAAEAEALYGGRPGIAAALIGLAGVTGTALMLYGMWRVMRDERLRSYRFFAAAFIVLYIVFVATSGRPYYLGGLYGVLAAVGAVALQHRRQDGHTRWRWVAWPASALSAAAAIGMLTMSFSITQSDVGEKIAARTAQAYHALPPGQREKTAIVGQSYIVAAYVDGYSEQFDTPKAHSSNRGYGYFPGPAEEMDSVLYVGSDPGEIRPYFASLREVADGGEDASVWLGTEKQEPWASFWPRLRNLTVG